MLLRRVEITDFLSIKGKLPIDLDSKVTILLGANDHGKSNILAALEHLNSDSPIADEEANWDATGLPSISFNLSLDDHEKKEWKAAVELVKKNLEEQSSAATPTEQDRADSGPVVAGSPVTKKEEAAPKKEAPPKKEVLLADLPDAALNGSMDSVWLVRSGVGSPLRFEGLDIDELPKEMKAFFVENVPRIELIKAFSESLQDSTTAQKLQTDDYEFLQGVFFYAGLDPLQSSSLFSQNDKTTRALDIATEKLDRSLRSLWGQGTDLHFCLRHNGNEIEFLTNDPAVTTRVARMSKRSAGVTQFFRVSMVLHARRSKHPANSYIYLFDEPGVYLHPQGQRDLLQVFETLSDENQIVYATHSLFLLNQNFPERHRLVFKDRQGTKVDQKPYRQNWKLATDALGVYLASNILFATKVLLVEGDSDPIFLYELFRQLNRLDEIDTDLNMLGVMSFYDYQNLRFLLQVFKKEAQETMVVVLVDGDSSGRAMAGKVQELCKRLLVPTIKLPEGHSIEDYSIYEDQFLSSVKRTLQNACEMEGKEVPNDIDARIQASWTSQKPGKDKPERRTNPKRPSRQRRRPERKRRRLASGSRKLQKS